MDTQRGTKRGDDVLSKTLFRAAELSEVELAVGPLDLLALLFFLNRHADGRAFVIVRGATPHDRQEEGDEGT